MNVLGILLALIDVYRWMIIIYAVMSWFHPTGVFQDVYRTLGTIVEPYIGIFRRFIPPVGMMDISPLVGYIVLVLLEQFLARLQ